MRDSFYAEPHRASERVTCTIEPTNFNAVNWTINLELTRVRRIFALRK
jgi:hypothetical protein